MFNQIKRLEVPDVPKDFDGLDELFDRGAFHKSRGLRSELKRVLASVTL